MVNFRLIIALLLLASILFPLVGHAENHALLIGVGEYPVLEKTRWLEGPPNDVRLLQKVLQQRGFKHGHIRMLVDGSDKRSITPYKSQYPGCSQ